MNNFLRIMALDEDSFHRTVFVNTRNEGGLNSVYDPHEDRFFYQVFIHMDFPLRSQNEWLFDTFAAARSFAADHFGLHWQMLVWDGEINRPCKNEDCGKGRSGNCKECANGGGCSSCGATQEVVL